MKILPRVLAAALAAGSVFATAHGGRTDDQGL